MSEQTTENSHFAELRKLLPPGSTVFTILRNVSRSGMSRVIEPVIIRDNQPRGIPYFEEVSGFKWSRDYDGYKVGGVGMDMGFHLVYSFSSRLYRDGYPCIGEGCPANDHFNGDRDYTPNHTIHKDGGYAIRQRWL